MSGFNKLHKGTVYSTVFIHFVPLNTKTLDWQKYIQPIPVNKSHNTQKSEIRNEKYINGRILRKRINNEMRHIEILGWVDLN